MSRLSTFFKDADTAFGVFSPQYFLLAIFPNFAEAEAAKGQLHLAGHVEEDVLVATGEEVVQFANEHLQKDGVWGMLMTELSRSFDTEATYSDRDLERAKRGEAFLAVYCPSEEGKRKAWTVLEPRNPLVARYYSAGGIEHLAGE